MNVSLENMISSSELDDRVQRLMLREVLDCSVYPQYGHLFFDFGCSSSSHIGSFVLPGPILGEIVEDMHESVEWKIDSSANQFGDKQIIMLRVIYISFYFYLFVYAVSV